MADAVIARVGRVESLSVLPIAAVRAYGGLGRDPLTAGREVRVDAVLDGRIEESPERIRITAQLVRVNPPAPLWFESIDGKPSDWIAIETAIAEAVAARLDPAARTPQRRP